MGFSEIANRTNPYSVQDYENFTNTHHTTEVSLGETYEITLEGDTSGNWENYFTVFIDWNQNGILDDAGEVYEIGFIANSTGTDGQNVTGNIEVPFGCCGR